MHDSALSKELRGRAEFRKYWLVFKRSKRGLRIQKHRIARVIKAYYYFWVPHGKII